MFSVHTLRDHDFRMNVTLEDAKVFGAVLLLALHELGELNLHVFKVALKHFT